MVYIDSGSIVLKSIMVVYLMYDKMTTVDVYITSNLCVSNIAPLGGGLSALLQIPPYTSLYRG